MSQLAAANTTSKYELTTSRTTPVAVWICASVATSFCAAARACAARATFLPAPARIGWLKLSDTDGEYEVAVDETGMSIPCTDSVRFQSPSVDSPIDPPEGRGLVTPRFTATSSDAGVWMGTSDSVAERLCVHFTPASRTKSSRPAAARTAPAAMPMSAAAQASAGL